MNATHYLVTETGIAPCIVKREHALQSAMNLSFAGWVTDENTSARMVLRREFGQAAGHTHTLEIACSHWSDDSTQCLEPASTILDLPASVWAEDSAGARHYCDAHGRAGYRELKPVAYCELTDLSGHALRVVDGLALI